MTFVCISTILNPTVYLKSNRSPTVYLKSNQVVALFENKTIEMNAVYDYYFDCLSIRLTNNESEEKILD